MPRVKNKIALITGAARGIGAACARLLHAHGATVVITDILDEPGIALADELGEHAYFQHLDVCYDAQWQAVADFIEAQFGQLDILVNNAGITGFDGDFGPQDPEHSSLSSWQYIHQVNIDSVFLGCKTAIRLMREHGGSIINMSSRSGQFGIPGAAAYSSSKAAIRNYTKTVAMYCAQQNYNIRCNSLHPGAILTPIWDAMLGDDREAGIEKLAKDIPLKHMGEPDDVAYAVLYLASDESKYITGIEMNIDGGLSAGVAASPEVKD